MTTKDNNENTQPGSKALPRPSLWKVMQSILAGALGVQSSKRHQEDFANPSPWAYIVGGILFTTLLIGGLVLLVNVVLANA
ncbi:MULTISPECIES: DUF2970 domain-containing protein [unclassified Marinobacter]|uniref:DUF2970 domain-containing protein n=1 Tax=unclassified Marinobacter TaxID=83889 RepID=UPI000BF3138F|nr:MULTISPECIES: DUF2970 domain-containing protein [unclassified Marinobacter]PFG08872.1 Protein of unknown function (DUF2970) [Marinobacter sp. LV10MA510-1]PFG54738.1 Protein of unknown function (DUF2970) [Marinobacter sp. LV10R520-4]